MSIIKLGLIGKSPPGKFKDIIDHLTRVKKKKPDLPDVFPASKLSTPIKKQNVEDMEAVNRFVRDNPRQDMAGGGRALFSKGKDVRVGKNQYGEFETTYKKPTTTLDKYQTMLDDFNLLVKESLKTNDGTKLPKDIKQYVNNYTFADGTKAKYSTYANLVARRSDPKYTKSLKPPVDVVKIKLSIMDNLITESNKGDKATNLTTLAKKVNWTDKDISNYKRQGKLKKLDSPADKIDKVYKNFFNNLDAPLENFFNPIYRISEKTGLNRGTVSTLLNKNPNYTDEGKKLFKALGTFSLKGKYAQEGFTIGQFLDDFENKLFVGENGLLSIRNYNKPTSAIVLDAYRHWNQGGKQIEWINPPKMDKKGNLISLADAQFKYTGPNSSDTIWSASGNTVNGVKSKSIAIFGKDAPEFQKVFKDYEDISRLENEIKPHPVTGKPTKMIDISKEAYNIGKGSSFGTSNLTRDHVNIIKDVFGNDPKYGTRILPRRINEYAGALKAIEQATKKGIGKNYTQNKIDKIYEKMGYNFTKNYDQILNDEYNLAKKVFNKFQAAGWGFDQSKNRWVIKEGFDEATARNIDARGNPKNPNKILQSPFKIIQEREALETKKAKDLSLTKGQRVVPPKSRPGQGGFIATELIPGVTKTSRRIIGGTTGFVLPELIFGFTDYFNERSKGKSRKEAAAIAKKNISLGALEDKEYMKNLKKVGESMGIDSRSFDAAYDMNVLLKNYEQNNLNFQNQYLNLLETGDEKRALDLEKNFDEYRKRTQNQYALLSNNISDNVMNTVGASPLIMEQGRKNITQEQFEKPFKDLQKVGLEKLKREKIQAAPTQKRQVDTTAGSIGEGFYQAFDSLTQGAKNLLQGRVIPFASKIGLPQYEPQASQREILSDTLQNLSDRDLERFNLGRGYVQSDPVSDLDLQNLAIERPGLFYAGGGIAKLAGDRSGPPPERGPNSQGLLSLKNRVRNL